MVSWRSGTCLVHPAEQWEMHACPRGTSTGFSKNTPVRDRRPGPILSEGSAPRRNLLSRANPKYHGPFGHPPRVANSSSSPSQRHDACASPPGAPPGTGRSAPRGFPLRTPSASLLRSPPRHPRCETSRSEFPFLCPRSRGNRAQARGFLPPVARAPVALLGLSSLLPFLPGSQGCVHLGKAQDFDFSRLSPDISDGGLRGGERALFLAPVAHAPRSIACAPVSVLAAPVGPKPVVEADPQFTAPGKTDHVLEKSYEQRTRQKKTRSTRGGRGGLTHPSPPPPTPLPGAQTAPTTRP